MKGFASGPTLTVTTAGLCKWCKPDLLFSQGVVVIYVVNSEAPGGGEKVYRLSLALSTEVEARRVIYASGFRTTSYAAGEINYG